MPNSASPPAACRDQDHDQDQDALLREDGPINPIFMNDAIRTLMRNMPFDPTEVTGWAARRRHAAMIALSALHPRDEIEVMLGIQAISAYQAASACWRIGMNLRQPNGDSTRHITTAASAARTFDSLLRALERRQVKPLAVPAAAEPRAWPLFDPAGFMVELEERCSDGELEPAPQRSRPPDPSVTWTDADIAVAETLMEQDRIATENQGLDIVNTEGIRPDGSIVMPDNPTPPQAAYIARRLALMYKREHAENLRKGIKSMPKIRPLRTGDLVP